MHVDRDSNPEQTVLEAVALTIGAFHVNESRAIGHQGPEEIALDIPGGLMNLLACN